MNTWTDTTFVLPDGLDPLLCVTEHEDAVSLRMSGRALDGRGFCLQFAAVHLPVVERLVEAVRLLQDREAVRALGQAMHRHTTHVDLDAEIAARRALCALDASQADASPDRRSCTGYG
mgnify:CR=1 FL=1